MVSDLSSRWCTGAGFLKARSSHCTVWCARTQHRNEHVLLMWLLHSTVNFKPPQLSYPISADLHSSAISSSAHISPGYFLLSNKPDLIFSVVVSDAPWLSWRWIRNKTKKSLDSLTEDLSLFLFFKLLGSFKIKNKKVLKNINDAATQALLKHVCKHRVGKWKYNKQECVYNLKYKYTPLTHTG